MHNIYKKIKLTVFFPFFLYDKALLHKTHMYWYQMNVFNYYWPMCLPYYWTNFSTILQHWLNKNTHDRLNGNNTTDVKEERDSTKNMILLAMLRLLQKERNEV